MERQEWQPAIGTPRPALLATLREHTVQCDYASLSLSSDDIKDNLSFLPLSIKYGHLTQQSYAWKLELTLPCGMASGSLNSESKGRPTRVLNHGK